MPKRKTGLLRKEGERSIQRLFIQRGENALRIARELVLTEAGKITCREAREALQYFMNEYSNGVVCAALISLACEAVGGDPARTIHVAVPVVLVSGSADVHDDIIDMTETKYGRPTVYGKYGKDIALLVGDALLFKGLIALQDGSRDLSREEFSKITGTLNYTFFELGDAEALEIRLRNKLDVTPGEYLQVMWKKAADVEGLFRIGATLGHGSARQTNALGSYGRIFGLLSILRDDWIDVMEFHELDQRIQFESLPLPLLYALEDKGIKSQLSPLLTGAKITKKDSEYLYEVAAKTGGFERARKTMLRLGKKAENHLAKATLLTPQLKAIVRFASEVDR